MPLERVLGGVGHGAVGPLAAEAADGVDLGRGVEGGPQVGLDPPLVIPQPLEEPFHLRRVPLVLFHVVQQRQRAGGGLAQLVDLAASGLEQRVELGEAIEVERPRRPGQRADRSRGVRVDRFAERGLGGVLFGLAALGGVDDRLGGVGEVPLELLEVGDHLLVGEHRSAVLVGGPAEVAPHPHDAGPLHHLEGVEGPELAGPDAVDRGAGGVVEAVGKAEVLPDEDDRVAAEVLGEVEREVGDGGAGLDGPDGAGEAAQQQVAELGVDHADRAGEVPQDGVVGLAVGDEHDVVEVGQALVEAGGDRRVVEGGDVVGPDAAVQQGAERGLGGDDHDLLADSRVSQEVDVLHQARAGGDADGGPAPGGVDQVVGGGGGGVPRQVRHDVLARPRGVDQRRGHVRAAVGERLGEGGVEPGQRLAVQPAGRGVGDHLRPLDHRGGDGLEPLSQPRPPGVVGEHQHPPIAQPVAVVDPLQHRPQHAEARLVCHHHVVRPGVRDRLADVMPHPDAQERHAGDLRAVDLPQQLARLLRRVVPAGQRDLLPRLEPGGERGGVALTDLHRRDHRPGLGRLPVQLGRLGGGDPLGQVRAPRRQRPEVLG